MTVGEHNLFRLFYRGMYIPILGLRGDRVDTACYSLFHERDIKKECYMHRMCN